MRSADGLDNVVREFGAGADAPNSIFIEIPLSDELVGLEAIETYIASLTLKGSPEGVLLGEQTTTVVNVLAGTNCSKIYLNFFLAILEIPPYISHISTQISPNFPHVYVKKSDIGLIITKQADTEEQI